MNARWLAGLPPVVAIALLAALGRVWSPLGPVAMALAAALVAVGWRLHLDGSRPRLLVAVLVAAAWIAGRDPFTPLVAAVVVAGAVILVLGRIGRGTAATSAYGALGLGLLIALTAAAVVRGFGLDDPAVFIGLAIATVAVRLAAADLVTGHGALAGAAAMLAAAAPGLHGLVGLSVILLETVGALLSAGPFGGRGRVLYAWGGLGALAGLV